MSYEAFYGVTLVHLHGNTKERKNTFDYQNKKKKLKLFWNSDFQY